MSLSDALSFERFQLGDWWDKIKDNPEQLLIGAGDPFSAALWGGITGKDYEPFVNALGGPQGSGFLGLGENGGVYERAQNAGINTDTAGGLHNAAELVAASYAGGYGSGQLSNYTGGQNFDIFGGDSSILNNADQLSGLLGGGQQPVDNTAHAQAVELERRKRASARGLL